MKKIIILFVLIFSVNSTNAQAFEARNSVIDIGYVLGSHYGGFLSPGVLVTYEKGVHRWIGVGAYGGFQFNGLFFGFTNSNTLSAGGMGAFHFYQMISDLTNEDILADKVDIALKVALGLDAHFGGFSFVNFGGGASILGRYYFTDNFGIHVEAGRASMGYMIAGATLKF